MADRIAKCTDVGQAQAAIAAAVAEYDAEALDEAVLAANVVAELAGNLMVREGERGAPRRLDLARGDGPDDDGPGEQPFVSLPWEEAIEEFSKRGNVRPGDLERLLNDVAFRSQQERQRMLQYVQERTYDLLTDAVADDGSSFKSFAAELRADMAPLGISATDDGYLQMVFRTNVQGAYSAGRDKASKDPELLAERPIALYLTAGDGLVRSEHAAFAEQNGGMYRIGSAEWEAVRPPPKGSPYNCRCSWVTLTLEQARERGWQE